MTKLTNELIAEAKETANRDLIEQPYLAIKLYEMPSKELAQIIYFVDDSELLNFAAKLAYQPNQLDWLSMNLYKLINSENNTKLNIIFASQQFMSVLLVDRPELIDNVRITRPSASEAELLCDALLNAANSLIDSSTKPFPSLEVH